MMPASIAKRLIDCPVYKISPNDTNYFALIFDEAGEGLDAVAVVEIFAPGGATPPNAHRHAHEMFFVLHGHGEACVDGVTTPLAPGHALLVKPGATHVVRNTGDSKLYCLTVMTPDEDFARLIRGGERMALDDEDIRVISQSGPLA
jgi:mannose-6-phosphate isomerase-like protein (cupin superfamily)